MTRVPSCAACGSSDFVWLFEKGGRHFWKCRDCGMQRQYPLPSAGEVKHYYDESYRNNTYRQFAAARELKQRTAAARWRAIRDYVVGRRWLDVGCADGTFLAELAQHDIDARGIDLSEVAVELATARGTRANCETVDEHRPDAPYDMVSAFDTLEHVLDPLQFLAGVRRLLRRGGRFVLTTPNLRSLSHFTMGRNWYFYIPEEHFFLFSPPSLRQLLNRGGFRLRCYQIVRKPLTFSYALSQLKQYNPLICRLLAASGMVLPMRWKDLSAGLPIGEVIVVAERS